MSGYTEDHLIEQPAIQIFEHELGWNSMNAYDEWVLLRRPLRQGYEAQEGSEGQAGLVSSLGREAKREVVLVSRSTGFDAPSCSTMYLDKPMRGHTLMQTIARANRVFGDKVHGLIVDYANVFEELEKALAIYGSGKGGRDAGAG